MKSFPKIMGILNVTPDSFSDGNCFLEKDIAINHAKMLLCDGADIIDIGGESTKPGAIPVSEQEEIKRVIPVITALKLEFPSIVISIDTTKYTVALEAAKAGASIINDISALDNDIRIANIAADYNMTLVLMHKQGSPLNMQVNPHYDNVVEDIFSYLEKKIELAISYGVQKIVCDPGIGFGKTLEHNIDILKNIDRFADLRTPIMLGISRKSFIGKITGIEDPKNRDTATALLHSLLLKKSIDIVRVHDVKTISLLRNLYSSLNKH